MFRYRPWESFLVTFSDTTCSTRPTGLAVVGFVYSSARTYPKGQRNRKTFEPVSVRGGTTPLFFSCVANVERPKPAVTNNALASSAWIYLIFKCVHMPTCVCARWDYKWPVYGDVKRRKTWRNGLVLDPEQSEERNAFALFFPPPHFFCQLFKCPVERRINVHVREYRVSNGKPDTYGAEIKHGFFLFVSTVSRLRRRTCWNGKMTKTAHVNAAVTRS